MYINEKEFIENQILHLENLCSTLREDSLTKKGLLERINSLKEQLIIYKSKYTLFLSSQLYDPINYVNEYENRLSEYIEYLKNKELINSEVVIVNFENILVGLNSHSKDKNLVYLNNLLQANGIIFNKLLFQNHLDYLISSKIGLDIYYFE